MALSVMIDDPTLPKGHELAIEGLGVFENGKAREVDAEAEDAFKTSRGLTVRQGLAKNPYVSIEETKKGGDS
jgi:hypothetical protein